MGKQTAKLISIIFMMAISLCLMVVSTYAWMVMSKNPAVAGIAVSVGGSDTIKLAPNVSEVLENGEVVNYPGYFSSSLNLDMPENARPLKPISTTDGVNWFFSKDMDTQIFKYSPGIVDIDVKSLRDDDFICDSTLAFANLEKDGTDVQASYLYFDFWVVSPSRECVLRVSTGENEGSYVINKPVVVKTETGYKLETKTDKAATYARVGFLVNEDTQTDYSMNQYVSKPQYNEAYSKLKGIYREKGEDGNTVSNTKFTIYEPNCDRHTVSSAAGVYTNLGVLSKGIRNGDYIITSPLSRVGNIHILGDIRDNLTAQKTTEWVTVDGQPMINMQFEAFMNSLGDRAADLIEEEIADLFYKKWMFGNYSNYLSIGKFLPNTSLLYAAGEGDMGVMECVPADSLAKLGESGATKDVDIVYLERNVPQRIRMYVYLEGQDVDCVSSNAISSLIVHMELAGSSGI